MSTSARQARRNFLQAALGTLLRLIQIVFHALLWVVYSGPGEQLPPIEDLILLDSATSLAQKIRSKKLTSEEVVQSFISRIKEINVTLNTVIDDRFEDALEDARKADDYIINSGKTKEQLAEEFPFLGVPFTVKDCIAVKGLSFTGGLYYRKDLKSDEDADCVACMRRAGGIPLGVTNVSELCLWWESYNKVYGRTNNPYNTNRIVGGSSGGEGCLQAAAGSPMGIGSDIGGSVRIPAFFNGVFGHKTSPGMGSLHGHFPVPREDFQKHFLTAGPLSRFATDLKPMLKAIAPGQVHLLDLDKKVDVTKLKYFYQEDDGGSFLVSPVEPEIKECIRKIVAFLRRTHGLTAEKVELKGLRLSMALWFGMIKEKGECQLPAHLADHKGRVNVVAELFKLLVGMSNHTFPVISAGVLEQFNFEYGSEYHQFLQDECEKLRLQFLDLLGSDGVFIYPTHPTAAPYHVEPIVKAFNVGYTAVFNVLGLPSTHVPMGLNKEGLPIGIQVVGAPNMDRLTIAVAEELERAFGGWVPPFTPS